MAASRETHYVYADGSCLGNPGPGGWAAVIVKPGGVSSSIYKRRRQTSGPASSNRHGRQRKLTKVSDKSEAVK